MKFIQNNIIILFVVVVLVMTYVSVSNDNNSNTYAKSETTKYYASNINGLNN